MLAISMMPPMSYHIIPSILFFFPPKIIVTLQNPWIFTLQFETKSILLWVNSYRRFYPVVACKETGRHQCLFYLKESSLSAILNCTKCHFYHNVNLYLQPKLTFGACFLKPHKKRLSLGPDQCNFILLTLYFRIFQFFQNFPNQIFHLL